MSKQCQLGGICPSILTCFCVIHVIYANCPPEWMSFHDSCYFLLTEKLDWYEASRVCATRPRSGLAVPNSIEENNFVREIQKEYAHRGMCEVGMNCGLWIGCKNQRDLTCQGQTKKQFVYDWIVGENYLVCVSITHFSEGKWKCGHCSVRKFAVCEMPRQVHIYSLTMGSNNRIVPQCLHDHGIKKVTVKGVIKCGKACWADPRCRSFNLWQGGRQRTCQLNGATLLESKEGDVIYDDECSYFGL